MRSQLLKMAVIAALGASANAFATGLETLPTAGFAVTAGSDFPGSLAGTTAYRLCNTTGNYGSGTYVAPTAGANNTCAVFPTSTTTSPVSGFSAVALTTAKQSVTITANGSTLATMTQAVYRNAGNTECIFQKRFVFATTGNAYDYNPSLTGVNYMEINDIALGGYSGTADVSAGYYHTASTDSPVFRMGRAFTSVQMQANTTTTNGDGSVASPAAGTVPALGYYDRPLTSPAPAASSEINGVGQTLVLPGNPAQSQQTAEIRTNWVDFTLDNTGGVDEDGTNAKDSPYLYVRSGCTSGADVAVGGPFPTTASTVRIRQTGQETQPWVTVVTSGVTRNGANANF